MRMFNTGYGQLIRATFELLESIGDGALAPRILEMRGRLATALGDAAAADVVLREALDLYRDISATGYADRLERELGATGSLP